MDIETVFTPRREACFDAGGEGIILGKGGNNEIARRHSKEHELFFPKVWFLIGA